MSNGPFRQIPNIGDRQQQAKQMIMQQIGQLSMSIFTHVCALRMGHPGSPPADFQGIARQSQEAAKAYFEGLGLAQFEKIEP